uniref:Uncharacterized protein n=1 Tax=Pristionchus pacificus TaxID=54126 RepID=A0A2A6C6X8_PRIPA|eukprot:PDM73934.1 hypothetical protein PRIPAC_41290 [Pristionchus pacificus]
MYPLTTGRLLPVPSVHADCKLRVPGVEGKVETALLPLRSHAERPLMSARRNETETLHNKDEFFSPKTSNYIQEESPVAGSR